MDPPIILNIMGVRHYHKPSLEKVLDYVSRIPNPEKGEHIFLLEYLPESLMAHAAGERGIRKALRTLSKKERNEFYVLTDVVGKRGIAYRLIDTAALEAKDEFLRKAGWREFIRFLFHRGDVEQLRKKSPLFYENMIQKREEAMAEEIRKTAEAGIFKNIAAVVGNDHKEALGRLLKDRLQQNVQTNLL